MPVQSLTNFCEKLYETPEQNPGPTTKSTLDHIRKFSSTTNGSWDIFTAFEQIATNLSHLPQFGANTQKVLGKIMQAMGNAGSSMAIPKGIENATACARSVPRAYSQTDIAHNDPARGTKIARSYKNALFDGINLSNNFSQTGLFLHSVKIVKLAPQLFRQFSYFFSFTLLLSDGDDLISQCFKLKKYHTIEALPGNQAALEKISEKKNLAWIVIAQDVAGIGLSCLSIAGLALGTTAPLTGILLGTTWISAKISSHFYEKALLT